MTLTHRSGRPPIQDEFTDLPITAQAKFLRRLERDHKCKICRQPTCEASRWYCLPHWQERETKSIQAQQNKAIERYMTNREVRKIRAIHPKRRPFRDY